MELTEQFLSQIIVQNYFVIGLMIVTIMMGVFKKHG